MGHSTEAEQDLSHYLPFVRPLGAEGKSIRLLDFGCGGGEFSVRFIAAAGFPAEKLTIALVDPDEGYLKQAATRTQVHTTATVSAWPSLPPELKECFDLILANHVFYYVIDLDQTLRRVLNALAVGGLFLISMAGRKHDLVQLGERCFALINRPYPYHRSEDLEQSLARLGQAFQVYQVPVDLVFPDQEENRLKVLRFLLSDHFAQMDRREILKLFDAYSVDGSIVIQTFHNHYVIRK
jgi:SAM-dependent methyltransferase